MAGADYYSCDWCSAKTFYDANMDYNFDDSEHGYTFFGVGKMVVLCQECSRMYEIAIVAKENK